MNGSPFKQSLLNFLFPFLIIISWSYWTFAGSHRANSMLSLRAIPINRGRTRVLRKRLDVNLFGRSWRQYRLRNFGNYLKLSLPFFLSVRTLLLLAIRLIYSCARAASSSRDIGPTCITCLWNSSLFDAFRWHYSLQSISIHCWFLHRIIVKIEVNSYRIIYLINMTKEKRR